MPQILSNREKLYTIAVGSLGTDASPADEAPDELGCAETVTELIAKVNPMIQWTNRLSTYYMRNDMKNGKHFIQVAYAEEGDICISATSSGGKNGITSGHVGIYMGNDQIASNDSRSGLFEINYTLASWRRYFVEKGGYEMLFFRLL